MKTKEKKDHNLEMIKKKNKLLEFIVVKIIYSFSDLLNSEAKKIQKKDDIII